LIIETESFLPGLICSDTGRLPALSVDVAEWSREGVREIADGARPCIVAQVDEVVQAGVATGWVVFNCDGPANGKEAFDKVLVLPDPKDAVNIRVTRVAPGQL
jgi:hypothetical protein